MPTPKYENIEEDDQKISHPPNSGPRMTQEEEKALFFGTFPEDRINSLLLNVKTSKSAALENTALKMLQFFLCRIQGRCYLAKQMFSVFKRSTLNKEK